MDYVFRADVKDGDGNDVDACEGPGMGADRNINEVGEGAASYTFTIAGDCPAGDHRAELTLSDPQGAELAGAHRNFNVEEPPQDNQPDKREYTTADATLATPGTRRGRAAARPARTSTP